MNALDYWKQLIIDYIDCCVDFDSEDFTEEEIEQMAKNLLDNDHLWTEIDYYVDEEISWSRKNK